MEKGCIVARLNSKLPLHTHHYLDLLTGHGEGTVNQTALCPKMSKSQPTIGYRH